MRTNFFFILRYFRQSFYFFSFLLLSHVSVSFVYDEHTFCKWKKKRQKISFTFKPIVSILRTSHKKSIKKMKHMLIAFDALLFCSLLFCLKRHIKYSSYDYPSCVCLSKNIFTMHFLYYLKWISNMWRIGRDDQNERTKKQWTKEMNWRKEK